MSPDTAPFPSTPRPFAVTCPACDGSGDSPADVRARRCHANDPNREGCRPCEGTGKVGPECAACGGEVDEDGECRECDARHCRLCWSENGDVTPASAVTGLCDVCAAEAM